MDSRNTFPCRGCGKPFLREPPRNRHESSCPQADEPENADISETEPPEAPDSTPEPQGERIEEPDAEPDPGPAPDPETDSGCSCCGAAPGSLSINGMCYGCELAGCDPDSLGRDHLPGGG